MLQTEFEFTLPCGFLTEEGELLKSGIMRRATAADEIRPLRDPRVVKNNAYLIVILLSNVITRLGYLESNEINPKLIENLYAKDLAFLQELYNQINQLEEQVTLTVCPQCREEVEVPINPVGESLATP